MDLHNTGSCKVSGWLYMLSCTPVLGFKFILGFKSKKGLYGAGAMLGKGSVKVTWEMRCTFRLKSNL